MKCLTQFLVKSYEFIFLISDDKETATVPTTSSSTTGPTTKRASTLGLQPHVTFTKIIKNFLKIF